MNTTGKIIATCGHELDDIFDAYPVRVKSQDRQGNNAVSAQCVCYDCMVWYHKEDQLLFTANEELSYMNPDMLGVSDWRFLVNGKESATTTDGSVEG